MELQHQSPTRVLSLTFTFIVALSARAIATPNEQIEKILEQVESRGDAVNDIECKVIFTENDLISDDSTKRHGTIIFKRNDPNPVFQITFDKTVQDGEVSKKKSWYLFDGRYFLEAKERSKSIIRRDIAPPGTQIDLFSMDNAPFPIPFGQKKGEILNYFDVTLGTGAKNQPADTDHLVCKPKPNSRFASEYAKLEFFVARTAHLPVRIVMTHNPPNKIVTADFPNITDKKTINTGISLARFKLPAETRKYSVADE